MPKLEVLRLFLRKFGFLFFLIILMYVLLQLSSVKAGGMMSFAIDSLGALWMWGNCPQQTDAGEFCIASSSFSHNCSLL